MNSLSELLFNHIRNIWKNKPLKNSKLPPLIISHLSVRPMVQYRLSPSHPHKTPLKSSSAYVFLCFSHRPLMYLSRPSVWRRQRRWFLRDDINPATNGEMSRHKMHLWLGVLLVAGAAASKLVYSDATNKKSQCSDICSDNIFLLPSVSAVDCCVHQCFCYCD